MTQQEQRTVQQISIKQAVMEANQVDMAKLLEKLDKKLDDQSNEIAILNKKFDELTGAKKFLIWFTATFITLTGVVTAIVHEIYNRKG